MGSRRGRPNQRNKVAVLRVVGGEGILREVPRWRGKSFPKSNCFLFCHQALPVGSILWVETVDTARRNLKEEERRWKNRETGTDFPWSPRVIPPHFRSRAPDTSRRSGPPGGRAWQ